MEIRIAPFTFLISLFFTGVQIILFWTKIVFQRSWKYFSIGKLKSGNIRSIALVLFSINLFIFSIYNVIASVFAYSKGYVIYRSDFLSKSERNLQIIEIIFESLQKSLAFFSLILFLPVFCSISNFTSRKNSKPLEFNFILVYSFLRIMFYPTVYIIFYRTPMLGLYFIEIINVSETVLLLFFYFNIYTSLKNIIGRSQIFNLRKTAILQSIFHKFKVIATLFFMELIFEIIYKFMIISLIIRSSLFGYNIILDLAFFLKIITFSIQFYCILNLSLPEDKDAPETIFWEPSNNSRPDFLFYNPYIKESSIDFKFTDEWDESVLQPNNVDACDKNSEFQI
ncbi:hypothetical protein CWI37_0616p0040 [Hamiltosporidium tvaerminnensis]|uniref:Transmembrane protein n=3 Tax=Hamiltosporidium TaxID=1176354 RepID=A0A4V2JUS0_9MICR|nr:hypothetical protein CWI39_1433p0010 [Hamiltosporidium magnivora]TBU01841.1 hypothetical protein CWI37_0616p0040 [Hamiltosporidium tvaerminnensis]